MLRFTPRVLLAIVAILTIVHVSTEGVGAAPASDTVSTWEGVRQKIPADLVVLRPAWLPARFHQPPFFQYVTDDSFLSGPSYLVGYSDGAKSGIIFALGDLNSCDCITGTSSTQVRGHDAFVTTTSASPALAIAWHEDGTVKRESRPYVIQTDGVTRAELDKIVVNLTPVTARSTIAVLPRSGGLPIGLDLLAIVGILLVGAGLRHRL